MISAAGFKLSPFRKNKSMLQSVELYRYLANVQKKVFVAQIGQKFIFWKHNEVSSTNYDLI